MAELDHWHPVLRSEDLRDKPAAVRLAGQEIVVFRTPSGALGALSDRCPHRGMRLSAGWVEGERLVCRYHGWRWAPDGRGESPGTPTAKPCAVRFDVAERHGAVWVKRAGAEAAFPRIEADGFFEVGRFRHRAKAPLELVLDNFTEIEHTPTTHALLGYPLERMAEVETRTTVTEDAIRVYNVGPQRKLPAPLYAVYRIPRDAWFVDDWTTRFSPVHCIYNQYWVHPETREPVGDALRVAVFFNPVGPAETEIVTLAYATMAPWSRLGLGSLLLPLTRAFVDLEVRRDCALLGQLADLRPSLQGNALGRFDKALVASRRRIASIYRGRAEEPRPGDLSAP